MSRILRLQTLNAISSSAPAGEDSTQSAGLCSTQSAGLCSTQSAGLCGADVSITANAM